MPRPCANRPRQVSPPQPRTSICQTRASRPWALARRPSVGGWLRPSEEHPSARRGVACVLGEGAPAPVRPRTDAGCHGPEHRGSPAPLQRHRLRGAGGLTTGAGDMPSLHCPQPPPAKQTASPGGRREGPCGAAKAPALPAGIKASAARFSPGSVPGRERRQAGHGSCCRGGWGAAPPCTYGLVTCRSSNRNTRTGGAAGPCAEAGALRGSG